MKYHLYSNYKIGFESLHDGDDQIILIETLSSLQTQNHHTNNSSEILHSAILAILITV